MILGKKAQEAGIMSWLIKLFIGVFVLVLVVGALYLLGIPQMVLNFIPSFSRGNSTAWDSSNYTSDIRFNNPDGAIFSFAKGNIIGSESIYFKCERASVEGKLVSNGGWFWSDNGVDFANVLRLPSSGVSEVTLSFMQDLQGKDCETGAKMLVTRTLVNQEAGWIYDSELKVYPSGINGRSYTFKKSDALLNNVDRFIAQVNKYQAG